MKSIAALLTLAILFPLACSPQTPEPTPSPTPPVRAIPPQGELRLPRVFDSGMVLQREMPIPVWGWAKAGEKVSVSLYAAGATSQIAGAITATADANGRWRVNLPAHKAGGPFELRVAGEEKTIKLSDVLVGEVWICSGQSNMEWPLANCVDADKEVANAKYPMIREFKIPRGQVNLSPQDDLDGKWTTCSPATAKGFTGAGYFFARRIHQELGVPVGLINNSWGGMTIEPFTPRDTLAKVPGIGPKLADYDDAVKIAPLTKAEFEAKSAAAKKSLDEAMAIEADEAAVKKMADPNLDTADWKQMKLPMDWKKSALPNYDGVVWLRKTVDIPSEWAGKDLLLQLAPVDEVDVTLFNGVEVGRTGNLKKNDYLKYWNVARTYKVPAAAVKGGKAVIAVRCISVAYAGGLWSEKPFDMQLLPTDVPGAKSLSLNGPWQYKAIHQILPAPEDKTKKVFATTVWNAMVRPLVPFAIRGVLWYQGESNLFESATYTAKMQALIAGWRQAWGQGDFPFYYVQLAPYRYGPATQALPLQWEAQTAALSIPNTGMACTVDIGDPNNIHPKNKQAVGQRLALLALAKTYGQDKLVCSGPMYKSVEFKDGKAILTFDGVGSGLVSRDGKDLTWFTIAGDDSPTTIPTSFPGTTQPAPKEKVFIPAQAKIVGNTVVVWAEGVAKPTAVRFAWRQDAEPNLSNKEGLPAVPFRTDKPASK